MRCREFIALVGGVVAWPAVARGQQPARAALIGYMSIGPEDEWRPSFGYFGAFVQELAKMRSELGFRLIGYVVMPEHVHLLVSEPPKGNPSKVLQVLKQKVSAALRRGKRKSAPGQLALAFPEREAGGKHFWQRRFYDFNVWSEKKLWEKLNYMHRNPVERKLVAHPKDWPWSSWGHYEKGEKGLLRIDRMK